MVASKQIRPNSEYHVAVSLLNSEEQKKECEFRVSIQNDNNDTISQNVKIQPYTTTLIKFHVITKI